MEQYWKWSKLISIGFIVFPLTITAQIRGRVKSVHDGDTFTLLASDGRLLKIRLAVVDAPELKQPYGHEAKMRVSKLILGKTVTIDSQKVDKYGRMIAMVYRYNDTLNYTLLREGLAWHYNKYDSSAYARDLQATARDHRKGLWACAQSPWSWRHPEQ